LTIRRRRLLQCSSTRKAFPISAGKLFIFHEILVGAVGIENNTSWSFKDLEEMLEQR
jgi:hypothetical protein